MSEEENGMDERKEAAVRELAEFLRAGGEFEELVDEIERESRHHVMSDAETRRKVKQLQGLLRADGREASQVLRSKAGAKAYGRAWELAEKEMERKGVAAAMGNTIARWSSEALSRWGESILDLGQDLTVPIIMGESLLPQDHYGERQVVLEVLDLLYAAQDVLEPFESREEQLAREIKRLKAQR